jgi:hypothetical protein
VASATGGRRCGHPVARDMPGYSLRVLAGPRRPPGFNLYADTSNSGISRVRALGVLFLANSATNNTPNPSTAQG